MYFAVLRVLPQILLIFFYSVFIQSAWLYSALSATTTAIAVALGLVTDVLQLLYIISLLLFFA